MSFFFSSRRRHTRWPRDWSSDVCSSDLAHLGYFHDELVKRRGWMSEEEYADLVALCQFLPGPASSQVGIGLGISRAGLPGGLAAWLGFTLPSAVALIAFACGVTRLGGRRWAGC